MGGVRSVLGLRQERVRSMSRGCQEGVRSALGWRQVWKTYMGRNRSVGTLEALKLVYKDGGVSAFYAGLSPKARCCMRRHDVATS
jgi:hypothetical protein